MIQKLLHKLTWLRPTWPTWVSRKKAHHRADSLYLNFYVGGQLCRLTREAVTEGIERVKRHANKP
jgi:hypothetical protein